MPAGGDELGVGVRLGDGVGDGLGTGLSSIAISIKSPKTPLICTLIVSVPSTIPSSTALKVTESVPPVMVKLPVEASAISPLLIPLTAYGTFVPSATFVVSRVTVTLLPS